MYLGTLHAAYIDADRLKFLFNFQFKVFVIFNGKIYREFLHNEAFYMRRVIRVLRWISDSDGASKRTKKEQPCHFMNR